MFGADAFVMDSVAAISIGFLGVVAAAFVALCALRHWHGQRTAELDLALEELEAFAQAVETLERDPRTPQVIKDFIDTTTYVIANHRFVASVAKRIAERRRSSRGPNPETARVVAAMQQLEVSAPELAEQTKAMVVSAMIAMMLRWPETRQIALKVAAKTSDSTFLEASSETIFAAVAGTPDCALA